MSSTYNERHKRCMEMLWNFLIGLNIIIFIYIFIIDIIVMANIYPTSSMFNTTKLYNNDLVDSNLNHWLKVYGAITVTKTVLYYGIFNETGHYVILFFLCIWVIPGTYLYITQNILINELSDICSENNISINNTDTCNIYNNQFQTLIITNQIELFSSIIILTVIFIYYMIINYDYVMYGERSEERSEHNLQNSYNFNKSQSHPTHINSLPVAQIVLE